jgi:hypothetical protein
VTLLVVDGANVVGSRPDGWWRDRAGAAERLRDALVPLAAAGLPDLPPPLDVVLVVEGRASGVTAVDGVRVVAAPGSGDDMIVELVAAALGAAGEHRPEDSGARRPEEAGGHRPADSGEHRPDEVGGRRPAGTASGPARAVVVTADRGLRERVRALGAEVRGPRALSPAY